MSESTKLQHNISLISLLVLLVGILGIFAASYYTAVESPVPGSFSFVFSSALTTLGVALIGYAIFSFAIDTRNWREYFTERIKEIVLDNSYLSHLDPETLKSLQTNVLKAQFKNPGIDREGGFLNYFHLNLHKFISEPYREDVSAEVLMTNSTDRPDCFDVIDKTTYVCRASSNRIQPSIIWEIDEGEFESARCMTVTVQYPDYHEKRGQKKELKRSITPNELKGLITIPLDDYADVDGLVVVIEAEYMIRKGKFQYWQMAHPSKNFDITVTYPAGAMIQLKPLVLESVVSQITQQDGYLKFKYDTWLLPESGIAWLITPQICVIEHKECFTSTA